MICRNEWTKEDYNYEFVENGMVRLWRPDMAKDILVKYEDWCDRYYKIDKWGTLQ